MRSLNKKGYTMIELLAVVTILGIIMTVTIGYAWRLIQKAKDDSMEQQEKLVSVAAESYFQANRGQLPKKIGETSTISINALRESNYLKEDIKNAKGESCMEKSFITAYKKTKTKYTYKVHFYCGDEVVPAADQLPKPNITIDFCREIDGGYSCKYKDSDDLVTEEVGRAFISIVIDGNQAGEEVTKLKSYSWSISAVYRGETEEREIYSSGNLNASGEKSIHIPKDESDQKYILSDYLDVTAETRIIVRVNATNEKGVTTEKESAVITYKDTTPPTCSNVTGQAISDSDWISKSNSAKKRTITTECMDGNGSGCVRNKFTKTWPTSSDDTMEYDYIKIEDNAGNSTDCRVRVNVDLKSPIITLNSAAATGTTTNVLESTIINTTSGRANDTATLKYDQYNDLTSTWMNSSKFHDGVTYTFTITDNVRLANWKFETNKNGLNMPTNGNPAGANGYSNLSLSNSDAVALTQFADDNSQNAVIQVSFSKDGVRQGKLTVTDIAGNTATYIIQANLDRSSPSVPAVNLYKWPSDSNSDNPLDQTAASSLTRYTSGSWSNKYINSRPGVSTDTGGSGIKEYRVTVTGQSTNVTNSVATYRNVLAQGESTVQWRACDKAGNCSNNSTAATIKIDKTGPELTIKLTSNGKTLKSNEISSMDITRTITATDSLSGVEMNSSTNSKIVYYLPKAEYSASTPKSKWKKAGYPDSYTYSGTTAVDQDNYYRVYDNAGNHSKDVRIIVKYQPNGKCFKNMIPNRNEKINLRYEPTWGKINGKWCGQGVDGTHRRTCSSVAYYYIPSGAHPENYPEWQVQVVCDSAGVTSYAPSGASIKNEPSSQGGIICYSSDDHAQYPLGDQILQDNGTCSYVQFVKLRLLVKKKDGTINPYLYKTIGVNPKFTKIPDDFVGGTDELLKKEEINGNLYYYFYMSSTLIDGIDCNTTSQNKKCACNGETGCSSPNTNLCNVTNSTCHN